MAVHAHTLGRCPCSTPARRHHLPIDASPRVRRRAYPRVDHTAAPTDCNEASVYTTRQPALELPSSLRGRHAGREFTMAQRGPGSLSTVNGPWGTLVYRHLYSTYRQGSLSLSLPGDGTSAFQDQFLGEWPQWPQWPSQFRRFGQLRCKRAGIQPVGRRVSGLRHPTRLLKI